MGVIFLQKKLQNSFGRMPLSEVESLRNEKIPFYRFRGAHFFDTNCFCIC